MNTQDELGLIGYHNDAKIAMFSEPVDIEKSSWILVSQFYRKHS